MNKLQDLQDKFFLDIQNIIQDLSEVDSVETLLGNEFLIKELSEKTAFLKYSQALDFGAAASLSTDFGHNYSAEEIEPETHDTEPEHLVLDLEDNQILAEAAQEEMVDEIVEYHEVLEQDELSMDLSDNEMFKEEQTDLLINDTFGDAYIEDQIIEDPEENILAEDNDISTVGHNLVLEEETAGFHTEDRPLDETVSTEESTESLVEETPITEAFEEQKESGFSFAFAKNEESENQFEGSGENQVLEEQTTINSSTEEHEEIIEEHTSAQANEVVAENNVEEALEKTQINEDKVEPPVFQDSKYHEDKHQDKKFKLSNIKGVTKSLFDLDHPEHEEPINEAGSLLKNNVATDYMEAPKPKGEFRLDLNDKIAFTQKLFNNSQVELNQAITRLNSYQSLDAAKEYLSDLYYERNWQKADSYAQRLWTLVENRFL